MQPVLCAAAEPSIKSPCYLNEHPANNREIQPRTTSKATITPSQCQSLKSMRAACAFLALVSAPVILEAPHV